MKARISLKHKIEALENSLITFKFNPKYFIHTSDVRCGQKFAIAERSEPFGSLRVHTNYMTYEEMNCFFMGYNKKSISAFTHI